MIQWRFSLHIHIQRCFANKGYVQHIHFLHSQSFTDDVWPWTCRQNHLMQQHTCVIRKISLDAIMAKMTFNVQKVSWEVDLSDLHLHVLIANQDPKCISSDFNKVHKSRLYLANEGNRHMVSYVRYEDKSVRQTKRRHEYFLF